MTVDQRMRISLREWSAAEAIASDVDGVLVAVTDNGEARNITTGFLEPPCPRNVTVTAGGTAADIKAISVTVTGLRAGKVVSEVIGPFTENTAGTVAGAKIFDRVTGVAIPAHDGTGATTSVGFGELLGLPYVPKHAIKLAAYKDGVLDGSSTLTVGAGLENCHLDMNAALDGDPIALVYVR